MSDPESAGAAAASPLSPESAGVSENATQNYAFLVHSQRTLTQNLPPRVDNKLLARQKRRRTSPQDHKVLEEEYQRNPKPDKATRAVITKRVSLGEKEVQVWFQNRRQNDRRRSKPLEPHELVGPKSGMTVTDPSERIADDGDSTSADMKGQFIYHEKCAVNEDCAGKSLDDQDEPSSLESDASSGDQEEPGQLSTQTSLTTEYVGNSQQYAQENNSGSGTVDNQQNMPTDQSSSRKRAFSDIHSHELDGQLLLRGDRLLEVKSPPSLRLSLSFDGEAMLRKEDELSPSSHKGRNALRIAMSSDGKAVIRAGGEPSPSKNRVSMFSTRTPRLAGIRRSSSAVILGTPRTGAAFGRSRDPRNWESFFDTDARSALSTPACSQTKSRIDSPSLFRSRSQRSLSRSFSGRHDILATSAETSNTASSQTALKKRKLSRTVSSLGRLESALGAPNGKASVYPMKASKVLEDAKKDLDDYEKHLGDSDKENWIPGTRTSHVRRRIAANSSRRAVLKDPGSRAGKGNMNLGSMSNNRATRNFQGQWHKSNGQESKLMPELNADVSAFMAGGSGPSQEEDLDCIQGLLSLSQGAWR
ncbi:hypothetical protein MPDQ_000494 [Monascus purpureus]|uniref:Homeobox domain-containing protein n=1 Tax=Monascus purpureus TaxID=5098 RepID=A0A507QTQ6_MONPU|nr:hypothetical protein MPDQ_000494 [Monascus purpureus]BDD57082.1 hypothetical protein MAP00_002479 [Monascus purpureus]